MPAHKRKTPVPHLGTGVYGKDPILHDGNSSFLSRLREEAAGLSRLIFRDREADPYREYVVAYVTSAFAGMLAYWHDTGKRLPIQDLAGISRTLATQGMKGFP